MVRGQYETKKGEPVYGPGRAKTAVRYPEDDPEKLSAEDSPRARAELEARFLRTWGKPWASVAPMLAHLEKEGPQMRGLAAMLAEYEEESELLSRALAALADIRRWNEGHPGSRRLTLPPTVRQWAEVRALVRPERQHTPQERVIEALSPRGVLGMPPFGRALSDTETADVLLLLGWWPSPASTKGKSISQIVGVLMHSVKGVRAKGISEKGPKGKRGPKPKVK